MERKFRIFLLRVCRHAGGMNLTYRVITLAPEVSQAVRQTLLSPGYGHPAHVEMARSRGPCRSCLATFREGEEERILFTYNPFASTSGIPAPGPVFIHRDPCSPYQGNGSPMASANWLCFWKAMATRAGECGACP